MQMIHRTIDNTTHTDHDQRRYENKYIILIIK